MDWKPIAIHKLRTYNAKKVALGNIPQQIEALEAEMSAIKSASRESLGVHGGNSTKEDKVISVIMEKDELKQNAKIVLPQVKAIEKGLSVLSDDERLILDRFYINRTDDYVERLCEELCIERSQVYRDKDKALNKFITAMYGIIDI